MWLQGCRVVTGHDMDEVNATTVEEERKGWLVKKTGVGASFLPTLNLDFFLFNA
jgi:hypothetical protein